jgi:hypothetical protein
MVGSARGSSRPQCEASAVFRFPLNLVQPPCSAHPERLMASPVGDPGSSMLIGNPDWGEQRREVGRAVALLVPIRKGAGQPPQWRALLCDRTA